MQITPPTRTFIVGDIQGYYKSFVQLLERIQFNPKKDHLFFLGDIVNRGPDSDLMLDWALENQDCSSLILGNHEEYLLDRYSRGEGHANKEDTLEKVWNNPNKLSQWVEFLKNTPYLRWIQEKEKNIFLVHAGINPLLTLEENYDLGKKLSWKDSKEGLKKYFLYLRYLDSSGNFAQTNYKGPVDKAPENCFLWTEFVREDLRETSLFFGHFAALGLYKHPKKAIYCLDSGLSWGQFLSCYWVEGKKFFRVDYEKNE